MNYSDWLSITVGCWSVLERSIMNIERGINAFVLNVMDQRK